MYLLTPFEIIVTKILTLPDSKTDNIIEKKRVLGDFFF